MKKIFLLSTFFMLLCVYSANAQIEIGLKAGVNFASVSEASSGDGRTGFHAGVWALFAFSEMLALMPELYWSQQGADDGDQKWDLQYFYIPILLRIHILAGLYGLIGPQIGINTKSEFKDSSGSFDYKDFTNSIDFAIAVGVMYQILRFHVYARYVLGISDIEDFEGASGNLNKNRLIQFGVAMRLLGGS